MSIEKLKLFLGSLIILAVIILAGAIALGKVEEKTSYGLTGIIAILGKVSLDFSQWAFATYKHEDRSMEKKDDNIGKSNT